MYVTGGQFKGHKIIIPDCAKPTLSKVRESVFNVLFSEFGSFEGCIFLDMFSGSGIMALEAFSRGFDVVCVEKSKAAVKIIKRNLEIINDRAELVCMDALKFAAGCNLCPDVVYIDPPWGFNYERVINTAIEFFKGAVLVIEYDKKRARKFGTINYINKTVRLKEKIYGRCRLDFLKVL